MKQKCKRKKPVARTPKAVAKFKKLFLKQLELGRSPGVAAENIGIGRSTAYNWKQNDADFSAEWVDAVETSLDKLETQLYDNALAGNSSDLQFALKHRRKAVYGNITEDRSPASQTNFIANVTLQEHLERLDRLGLPRPVIETDEEDYEPKQIIQQSR